MLRATFLFLLLPLRAVSAEAITPHVSFERAAVNSALVEQDGKYLAIYGTNGAQSFECEQVLLTHHRRDIVWKARRAIDAGAAAVAPEQERELIEKPGEFWNAFTRNRFHDYAQQSTKILAQPLPVDRWVKQGDVVQWRGLRFEVLDTPGYTRGAVSYVATIDGKKLAFTGDLIYGDGQLFDLSDSPAGLSKWMCIPAATHRSATGNSWRTSVSTATACSPEVLSSSSSDSHFTSR